jgi:hypothetical protein
LQWKATELNDEATGGYRIKGDTAEDRAVYETIRAAI